jgi:hypothetical protein
MENIKLDQAGKKLIEGIEGRIVLDVEQSTFTLYHTDNYDVVDVYMLLSAALDFIEAEAEMQVEKESRYLQ